MNIVSEHPHGAQPAEPTHPSIDFDDAAGSPRG